MHESSDCQEEKLKQCTGKHSCGKFKSLNEFGFNKSKNIPRNICRECQNKAAKGRERIKIEIICDFCGNTTLKNKDSVATSKKNGLLLYCSKQCQYAALRNQIPLKCQNCNVDFTRQPTHIKKTYFCSVACSRDFRHKNKKERKRIKCSFKFIRHCAACKKEIVMTLSSFEKSCKKYPEDWDVLCRSCASIKMHIVHEESYEAAKPKIAEAVRKEWAALSPKEVKIKIQPFVNGGQKYSNGNASKLEKAISPILEKFGFAHNYVHNKAINGYYPDFINEENKIILEVMGDYWHANPEKYSADWFHPIKEMMATEIWEIDLTRREQFKLAGYSVIEIWENDIRKTYKNEAVSNKTAKLIEIL